ncbi:MAG: DUF1223 domain-containing protein [Rhodobacteraceae bacterium]|nr:DUF1223 domain-containing protein [Paracoccaceae bacterium]
MKSLIATLILALGLSAGPVAAQSNPVVVELFTSQGCSSCPPADALMAQLASRNDVLPLALHVDYWDYIGWKDEFANPAHTLRQKGYARVAGRRSIYTPQMVINGQDDVVGARSMELGELIMAHKSRPDVIALTARRQDGRLRVQAAAVPDAAGEMVVQLVRYDDLRETKITRGENAGRQIAYVNVVREMVVLAEWDGREALTLDVPIAGDRRTAVLVQYVDYGAIVGAVRLD